MCRSNVVEHDGKTWKNHDIKPAEVRIVKKNRNQVYSNIPAGYALLDDGDRIRTEEMRQEQEDTE